MCIDLELITLSNLSGVAGLGKVSSLPQRGAAVPPSHPNLLHNSWLCNSCARLLESEGRDLGGRRVCSGDRVECEHLGS
ncbi:hypothetical protein SKAU_G00232430 [Synaphobranchus kaupii]|uniref:Uncharacterized protein n=1 Tax=Synaphobranchus kaupii TaxID=118154 RepID=A0A9Q1F5V0_SYNKA|nr:hypothetical protein SKAU_G00232430 [Synaphobranchus kaupii]